MRAAILVLALLTACAGGPYHTPPRYAPPESRTAAARQLNEAMAFGGIGYSDVNADLQSLRWTEPRTRERRTVWLQRELMFEHIRDVGAPQRDGERWEVRIDAAGGVLRLRFKDDREAAKAESALRRLSARPDAQPAD
jgi:hypothetical protein